MVGYYQISVIEGATVKVESDGGYIGRNGLKPDQYVSGNGVAGRAGSTVQLSR